MRGQAVFAPAGAIDGPLLSETFPAKEAKETDRLRWKSPRLFLETEEGLQCGLSGSRVARMATPRRGVKGETASIGNERYAAGKTNPYLSRKIYFFCRRCNYCQPCSAGINISGIFILQGYLDRYGLGEWAKVRYDAMPVKANACIDCGACETRCPYNLPIRAMLKESSEKFDD